MPSVLRDVRGDSTGCPVTLHLKTSKKPIASVATIRLSDPGAVPALLATCVLLACGHSEPFGTQPTTSKGPFQPGNPARLTLSALQDLTPSWLPDESGILYTFETLRAQIRDRCLGVLPAGGGTRFNEVCARSAGSLDSLDAFTGAVVSPGGRLAYVFAQSHPNTVNPDRSGLRVSRLSTPDASTDVLTFPTNIGGQKVDGASHIRWLSETRLVFLALSIAYPRPAPQAPPDTVPSGIAVALIDLANAPGQPVLLGGTESASSVEIGPDPETLLFTRNGDGNVFHYDVASGTASLFFTNFSPFGITRDISLRGTRLVAVAGGAVTYVDNPPLGRVQRDKGGILYLADLTSGQATRLGNSSPSGQMLYFRRPTLTAEGAVVAEGYVLVSSPGGVPDVAPVGDLWLFGAP